MNSECLGDAGSETVGLDEDADQGAHLIQAGAGVESLERIGSGYSRRDLVVDLLELRAELRRGGLHLFRDPSEGGIQAQSRLDTADQQVQGIGEWTENGRLALSDSPVQEDRGQVVPECGGPEEDHEDGG